MARSRLYVPSLRATYETWSPHVEWLLRVGLGIVLIVHSLQKFLGIRGGLAMAPFIRLLTDYGYPAPDTLANLLAAFELVAGVLLVIGFLTRPVALLVIVYMIFGIRYTANTGVIVWFRGGSESLMFVLVSLYVLIKGAGPWSVDSRMDKEF
jgi:putative oxidoreductase